MPKSKEPRAPARHSETDSAATAAERARAILERQLALKKSGPPGFDPKALKGKSSGKAGWSAPPIRPGGRGRRG